MDFIERVFGISPDGGSGVLELTLFVIPLLMFGLRVWWTQTAKMKDPGKAEGYAAIRERQDSAQLR